MSVVAESLSKVILGAPQTHRNLSLFPLLGDGIAEPGYVLLDAALAQGCARVTEVSEAGSVPELGLDNGCDLPVLLLDGEELIGAKQNRILNLSVLAPAGKRIVIPVSCVEAGRWHAESAAFRSAGRAHYAGGRARKAAQVSESLRNYGSRRSDQSAVWADISAKSARMDAASPTGAAAALYDTHRASLDEYLSAFAPVPAQLGALFTLNGQVLGLDLFDSAQTLTALLPKLVESSALDAVDAGQADGATGDRAAAQRFLDMVAAAQLQRFPAIGEGEDLRLVSPAVAGGALMAEARLVHLCAFATATAPAEDANGETRGSRIARASQRRSGRQ
ncbi:MAG: DUF6569 family protein [Halieaceae bacterium]|jgi:hypothetical protein|nr:DUF6569 family protein [Halieaceae bacterium]